MSSVAGAGKTTALKRELESLIGKGVLMITFNKSLEQEAKTLEEIFPNLSVFTFHGLAYKLMKTVLGDFTLLDEYTPSLLLELNIPEIDSPKTAVLYIQLLQDFFHSKKPMRRFLGFAIRNKDYRKYLGRPNEEKIRNLSKVWDVLQENKLLTHDAYTKLFQLKKPILKYDVVMVDEYQDFSESMIDVIENCNNSSKIIIAGDLNQRIYEWRGASGEFNIDFDETEELFNSWRCPREIVDVARPYTLFLNNVNIQSNKKDPGEVFIHKNEDIAIDSLNEKNITFLTRTNAYAFVLAEKLINKGFVVQIESSVNVDGIGLHWNWLHRIQTGTYLDQFDPDDLRALKEFYRDTGQDERVQQCNCALEINDFPTLVFNIQSPQFNNGPKAIITTVYKSKGLGFENVFIAKDFKSPLVVEDGDNIITDEDLKLIYVAITRSKKKLFIHQKYISQNEMVLNKHYEYIKKEPNETMLEKKIREALALKNKKA